MPIQSTSLEVTTAIGTVISTATTWANIRGGHVNDPVPVTVFNDGAIRVHVGSSALTSATGFPILSSGYWNMSLLASDAIFAITTGSTSTLRLIAGRQ